MSSRSRLLAGCLATSIIGIASAIFCVWIRASIPLPRWDVVISLSLSLAGLLGFFAIVSRGPRTVPPAATTTRYWWAEQTKGLIIYGLILWIVPVFFVAGAAITPSSQAWEIVEAGHTIRSVEVTKVMKSERVRRGKTYRYSNEVEVSASFGDEFRIAQDYFSSGSRAEVGDQVWILYAPSSPRLSPVIDDNKEDLERQVGGPENIVLVTLTVLWVGLMVFFYSKSSFRPSPTKSIMGSLRAGKLRSLPVRVDGVGVRFDERPLDGAKPHRPKPCVRMKLDNGENLDFFLEKSVDPVLLRPVIEGAQANLYWGEPFQRNLSYRASVGFAVLVLSDHRCLPGWVSTSDGSDLPTGEIVLAGDELPEGRDLHALRPVPLWDPTVHSPAVYAMLISLLSLLIISFGVGAFGTAILAVIAFASPMVAAVEYHRRLTQKLQGLLLAEERPHRPSSS